MPTSKSPSTPPVPAQDPSDRLEDCIDSEDLFKGRKEVCIRHNQDRYVLRITRLGKLILNK